jgi:xylose isomerase
MMLTLLEAGGLQGGGINFDAKLRRNSTDPEDLFLAHIGGADTFARALTIADRILSESDYRELRRKRYESFESGKGKAFEMGKLDLSDLYAIAIEQGELPLQSGKQEFLENLINRYI